ncbi:MAG TPA: DUF4446 family protein [Jatrophihabitantaceae bacterium]|nr:DUF4446 family protein [Jatrophihabitantaceae bacterium]
MSVYIAVFAMVLAYLALVGAYFALRTLAKLRRATAVLARTTRAGSGVQSLAEVSERQQSQIEILAEQLADLHQYVDQRCAAAEQQSSDTVAEAVKSVLPSTDEIGALRNVALVRYDAFTEMSGRMSFSLALLDNSGGGVVVSAIAGRSDTRVYAKGVTDSKGEHELSPEEQQAVTSAMTERRGGLLARKAG